VIEMIVGVLVVAVLLGLGALAAWHLWINDWLKDRALIREIGPLDGPPPILFLRPDGTEVIIPSTDPAYPKSPTMAAAAIRDQVTRARQAEAEAVPVPHDPEEELL